MTSKQRVRPDRGRANVKKLPRGEHGHCLCRMCGVEVTPPRVTFCSKECVHEWKLQTNPTYVRHCLYRRDHGVCRTCGVDTEKLRRIFHDLWLVTSDDAVQFAARLGYRLRARKKALKTFKKIQSLWEADHIVEVADGGGLVGLDGYQTLCQPCHVEKTTVNAAIRRVSRKSVRKERR